MKTLNVTFENAVVAVILCCLLGPVLLSGVAGREGLVPARCRSCSRGCDRGHRQGWGRDPARERGPGAHQGLAGPERDGLRSSGSIGPEKKGLGPRGGTRGTRAGLAPATGKGKGTGEREKNGKGEDAESCGGVAMAGCGRGARPRWGRGRGTWPLAGAVGAGPARWRGPRGDGGGSAVAGAALRPLFPLAHPDHGAHRPPAAAARWDRAAGREWGREAPGLGPGLVPPMRAGHPPV